MTFEQFLKEVEHHELTILKDDGLYRHIRLAKPGTYCMSFDLVTWPGYLAYTGDVGSFTFSRLRDMFEFFRKPEARFDCPDLQYWAEKCQAADKTDGIKRFSNDLFLAAIKQDVENHLDGNEADTRTVDEVLEAIYEETGAKAVTDGYEAMRLFSGEVICCVPFHDFWEHRLDDYTSRFQWCCFALPWAIAKYDAAMKERAGQVETGAQS